MTSDDEYNEYCLDPSICHYIVIEEVDETDDNSNVETSDSDPSTEPGASFSESGVDVTADSPHGEPNKDPLSGIRKRGRCADPSSWKQNARKMLYQTGQEHISTSGKLRPAKTFNIPTCRGCKPQCSSHFEESDLHEMFVRFWQLDTQTKRHYLSTLIHEQEVKRVRTKNEHSRRSCSRCYYLVKKNGKRHTVCRSFFCQLFSVSPQFVATICSKRKEFGILEDERRGKNTPKHALSKETIDYIKEHINSYPVVFVDRRRSHQGKGFLSHDLNLNIMYRSFARKCENDGKKPVCLETYRKIFKTQFNLSFLKQKKPTNNRTAEKTVSEKMVGHCVQDVILSTQSDSDVEDIVISEEAIDRCVKKVISNITNRCTENLISEVTVEPCEENVISDPTDQCVEDLISEATIEHYVENVIPDAAIDSEESLISDATIECCVESVISNDTTQTCVEDVIIEPEIETTEIHITWHESTES